MSWDKQNILITVLKYPPPPERAGGIGNQKPLIEGQTRPKRQKTTNYQTCHKSLHTRLLIVQYGSNTQINGRGTLIYIYPDYVVLNN